MWLFFFRNIIILCHAKKLNINYDYIDVRSGQFYCLKFTNSSYTNSTTLGKLRSSLLMKGLRYQPGGRFDKSTCAKCRKNCYTKCFFTIQGLM